MNSTFAKEIVAGLSATPKTLPSKYFYDKIGDQLFVKIMNAPEYYLTNAEYEIFTEQNRQIISAFPNGGEEIALYELGAGDGTKTIQLLKHMVDKDVHYRPIDISANAISNLEKRLKTELPELQFEGQEGEYFSVLDRLKGSERKVILFLGSNLGNMEDDSAKAFMHHLAEAMDSGDALLLGLDLIKSKDIVLPAYNDAAGHTRAFNLNLLQRINATLDGNFDVTQFDHVPHYTEEEGIAYSYLESKIDQTVTLNAVGTKVNFIAGERILMEISRKYNDAILEELIAGTGLTLTSRFTDSKGYFCDFLFEKH